MLILPVLLVLLSLPANSSIVLTRSPGWQYITIPASSEPFVLIEVRRETPCSDREFVIARKCTAPKADWNTATGMWDVDADSTDVEGWARNKPYHAVNVPNGRNKDVYCQPRLVGVYLQQGACGYSLTATWHSKVTHRR